MTLLLFLPDPGMSWQIIALIFAIVGVGVTMSIIGIVVVSSKLISKGSQGNLVEASSIRKCPRCAEIIRAEAKICRFCNSALLELE